MASAAVNALEWNTAIPKEKIMVFVEDGYIHLSGQVSWEYQRKLAQHILQDLLGVKGIINRIEIVPYIESNNKNLRALGRS
ncbi:BON domain-containing protein [Maribacter sp. 4G9]|uniref:BON domain-containing protein n=1 Tax=Maribacter sp. 4G9 TaxID=1889777 RepID=UPI0039777B89